MSTKHVREVTDEIVDWAQIGSVGKAIVFRDHNGNMAVGAETVVKLREMDVTDQEAIRLLVKKYQAFNFNIKCSGAGEPDRIEIYRQLL